MNLDRLCEKDAELLMSLPLDSRAEVRQLLPLVGRRIVGTCVDEDDPAFFGFRLDDGTSVWPWCDPEGNGPGHLNIEGPQ